MIGEGSLSVKGSLLGQLNVEWPPLRRRPAAPGPLGPPTGLPHQVGPTGQRKRVQLPRVHDLIHVEAAGTLRDADEGLEAELRFLNPWRHRRTALVGTVAGDGNTDVAWKVSVSKDGPGSEGLTPWAGGLSG